MTGWVWLSDNGLPHRAPEDAAGLLTARGMQLTDIPGDMPLDEEFDAAWAEWQNEQDAGIELPPEEETPIEADPAASEEETK